MYCDRLKKKNLLDFCENLLENLLKSPKKSKSKSAMTPEFYTIICAFSINFPCFDCYLEKPWKTKLAYGGLTRNLSFFLIGRNCCYLETNFL